MVLYLITIYMQIPSVFFKRGSYVIKHQTMTPFLIKVKRLLVDTFIVLLQKRISIV